MKISDALAAKNYNLAKDITDLPARSGVYLLTLKDKIVYIGKSSCLRKRGDAYRSTIKIPGMRMWWKVCKNETKKEKELIAEWKPIMNGKQHRNASLSYLPKKVKITPEQRKAFLDAGFPRQTLYKWLTGKAVPRVGNRILWKQITGREFPAKKRGNSNKSRQKGK